MLRASSISVERGQDATATQSGAGRGRWTGVAYASVLLVLTVASLDAAHAWKTKRVLSKAASAGARIAVSVPLNSGTCSGPTPCSIEAAAQAVKRELLNAGFNAVACIAPQKPSFSGILIWVFSCDGKTTCDAEGYGPCMKIDRTAITVEHGKWFPSTRITIRYPQTWRIGTVLVPLFPRGVSANVELKN